MTAPVVLVSGAGGGIGAATVRRFAAGGWRIVAVDLDSQALDRLDSAPVIARLPGDVRTGERHREDVVPLGAAPSGLARERSGLRTGGLPHVTVLADDVPMTR